MNNKIAFPELVQLIAEATGTTKRMSELFLKELFATVSEALIAGQKVTIKNLGTFETTDSSGHTRLSFKPDKALAAAVNQPFAAFESIVLSDDLTDDMLRQIDEGENQTDTHDTSETKEPVGIMSTPIPPPFVSRGQEPGVMSQVPTPMPESESTQSLNPELEQEQTPKPEPAANPNTNESVEESISENKGVASETSEEELDSQSNRTVQHFIKLEFEQEKREIAHKSFLRGMLIGVLATLALGAIIWGAWSGGRNSALKSVEQADTLTEAGTYEEESIKVPEQPIQSQRTPATQAAVVTDTCTATMYLSRMSIKHYGKPDFWIYIYEENRDKISDPNNVAPGTVLIIPPASKYGIDASDKASIDRARRRTYEQLR